MEDRKETEGAYLIPRLDVAIRLPGREYFMLATERKGLVEGAIKKICFVL